LIEYDLRLTKRGNSMATQRCEEDQGGVTLKQLLSLQASAGTAVYADGQPLKWLPDGSGILFTSSLGGSPNIWQVDPATGVVERVTAYLGGQPFLSTSLIDCSPDGRWISYTGDLGGSDGRERSSRVEIWLQSTASGTQQQLTSLGANISAYSWAPDGRSIVLSGNRNGRYDIYKVDVPSGQAVRLTDDTRYEVCPVFTPSGEHILYVRLDDRWAGHEIILMTAVGERVRTVATDSDLFDYMYGRRFGYPLVSPDGERVIFRSYRSGWLNYWQVPITGGRPQPVYQEESDQSDAVFSPSGHLAFVSNSNGTTRITVVPVTGESTHDSARILVNPELGVAGKPVWSPGGTQLAYLFETPTSPADLWLILLAGGAPRRLTSSPLSQSLQIKLANPEKVTYQSFDGLEISAYLYAPPNRQRGHRYPGLLLVHGGPTAQWWDTYHPDVQYFIRSGYVVLMPNIRGSSGYGQEFEDLNNQDWGHDDLQDVIAGVEYLKTLDYVDGDNIGIHGTSYGGCMSMSAVGFAPGIFQAAVPHAGYGDWLDFEDEQELRHRQLLRYEFGDVQENREVYRRCSPIYNVTGATTPMFLVHGEGHYPRSDASVKFARALEREYKVYEYKVYPNECYYVRSEENLREMYPDIVEFLDRYLKGNVS
jgi:dipeptidyl aminopeptidase/acylaminoacyl peptidase